MTRPKLHIDATYVRNVQREDELIEKHATHNDTRPD